MGVRRGFLLLAVVLLCLLAVPALAANRALLVGCDRFLSQPDTAPASENNVVQMARALSGGGMNPESLVTRRSGLGSERELRLLLEDAFGEAEPGDVCYFYISTHGLWEPGMAAGAFTFLLSDGRREVPLTAARLKELLEQYPGTKVLILDCCHSGAVIGKGVLAPFDRLFAGEEWKVICSSGGAEESWFWAGATADWEKASGAGYFSGALVRGISAAGQFAADMNRDGVITLTELRRWLLAHHGASKPCTWPEDSGFPVMTYDVEALRQARSSALVEGVTFEKGALSIAEPQIRFSYTVLTPLRMVYQLVWQQEGRWDFEHVDLIEERGTENPEGLLAPGHRERAITFYTDEEDYGEGYVLLQLLAVTGERVTVVGSTVLTIPPSGGDPALDVILPEGEAFDPAAGEEFTFAVMHRVPCELSVAVADQETGRIIRRLASREPTRPEQTDPRTSTFTWDGRRTDGTLAEPGAYVLRISAVVTDERWEMDDVPFAVGGGAQDEPEDQEEPEEKEGEKRDEDGKAL